MHYIIFSGANERAVIAAAKNLLKNGKKFSIIARSSNDVIYKSFLKKYVFINREEETIDLDDIINCLIKIQDKIKDELFYLPTTESINRLFLENKGVILSRCKINISIPDIDNYKILSDKLNFINLAKEFGIIAPDEILNPFECSLPIVAKPKFEFDKFGRKIYPELIFTDSQRKSFLSKNSEENFFFQNYIDGQSYYYLFFFKKNGEVCSLFQKNIAQQPNGKSILLAELCECPSNIFLNKIKKCISSVNFYGFCMVELIIKDGKDYLIELNPRLWGPFDLAVKGGFSVDWLEKDDFQFYPSKINGRGKYSWLSGILKTKKNKGVIRWFPGQKKNYFLNLYKFIKNDVYLEDPKTWKIFIKEITGS
jgi:predicted ATP-grasp superfamily ATP-dependent carboligase